MVEGLGESLDGVLGVLDGGFGDESDGEDGEKGDGGLPFLLRSRHFRFTSHADILCSE